jgi:hypothetical protein
MNVPTGGAGGGSGSGGGKTDAAGLADGRPADAPVVGDNEVAVLTNRYDNARSATNPRETILTTSNVKSGGFGLRFSRSIDGNAYAQPLYVPGLTIKGAKRNVVFVVTSTNWVYAFDADDPAAAAALWSRQLAPPGDVRVGGTNPNTMRGQTWCKDMFPFVGVTGTPVIDLASRRMFLVSKTGKLGGNYTNRLHALDILSGEDTTGSPVVIEASVPGTGAGTSGGRVSLDGWKHLNRPGLLLVNNTIYIAFASHCDDGPYHGWVLGYDPGTLAQTSVFNTAPNGTEAGIWQSGVGLSANDNGIFFVAGNGTSTPDGKSLGTAVVRLNANNTLADWFMPFNADALNSKDSDLTSGAVLAGNSVFGGGKEGIIYVIEQMNMTHFNAAGDRITQRISVRDAGVTSGGHLHSMAFWNNRLYVWPEEHGLKAYSFANGRLSTAPVVRFEDIKTKHPGAILAISANGTMPGTAIVWATLGTSGDAWHEIAGGTLVALDAMSGAKLWDSDANAGGQARQLREVQRPHRRQRQGVRDLLRPPQRLVAGLPAGLRPQVKHWPAKCLVSPGERITFRPRGVYAAVLPEQRLRRLR